MRFKNVALLFVLTASFVFAAPRPSLAPEAGIWTLDVVYTHPAQYAVKDNDGNSQIYWYTVLSMTNNSGQDVPFYPKFELMTDTWQIKTSDTGITKPIYDALKKMNEGSFPFLETMDEVDNMILQGEDNSVDLLVVWKDFDLEAKGVKFFFGGLSNETSVVEAEKDGETVKYYLQKTLELDYDVPGDEKKRQSQELVFDIQKWVMR
ncbi:MAG: hypothetical protein ACIAQZ_10015 [Sedimentisphaeraceae bacterium JB056]